VLLIDVAGRAEECNASDRGSGAVGKGCSNHIIEYCIVFIQWKQAGFNRWKEKDGRPGSGARIDWV